MGVGIPVELHIESVTTGYVFKAEYFLPENATNYLNYIRDPFDLTTRILSSKFVRKRRDGSESSVMEEPEPTAAPPAAINSSGFDSYLNEKYENYQVPVIQIEGESDDSSMPTDDDEDDEDFDDSEESNPYDNEESLYNAMGQNPSPDLSASRWNSYKSMAALAKMYVFYNTKSLNYFVNYLFNRFCFTVVVLMDGPVY